MALTSASFADGTTWSPPLLDAAIPTREARVTATTLPASYDLKDAVSANRLKGLWRLATGFRLTYLGATASLAICAAKTATALLLRYFVDKILGETQQRASCLPSRSASWCWRWWRASSPSSAASSPRRRGGDRTPAAQLSVRSHPAADLQVSRSHPDRRADPNAARRMWTRRRRL